ncbi:MAG TPA: Gfo/Idh/MocA family oxidoreductase [Candidatus Brocadiia bacterium]|nr:Gfo/Idh/MocA family oxidoreductase [Candidatus Brocadiia bacterium]
MAAKKVGWAIVGCGVIGPYHAESIGFTGNVELKAVCDVVPDKAKALGEKYGVPWFTDYEEMLAAPGIECVSICVPSGMHADFAITAAKRGKHVLSEKPIDINLAKIDRMIATCRECGVKLSCIFQRRTYQATLKSRQAVQKGVLGKMTMIVADTRGYRAPSYYASADWRGTWALDGGGCLMNQGVHIVDQMLHVAGPVEEVYAYADHLVRDIEVEDTCVAAMKFKNGAFGVLKGATSCNPGEGSEIALHGNNGTIILRDKQITKWAVTKKAGERAKPSEVEVKTDTLEAVADPKAISNYGHIVQIRDMANCIRRDREPLVSPESAKEPVKLILAIYQSAISRKPVRLDEFKGLRLPKKSSGFGTSRR